MRKTTLFTVLALLALTVAACSSKQETAAPSPASAAASPAVSSPAPTDGACDFTPPAKPASGKQFPSPPTMKIDPAKSYTAVMDTSCGTIRIDLQADAAPETVNNFVFLADQGWYDGIRFHRLANSITVIQAGDPNCSDRNNTMCGAGGPGYSFADELSGKERYVPGAVAMANAGPDTNGSQFFIVTGRGAKPLPPNYTVFGNLADAQSLKVAQTIQGLPVNGEDPIDDIWIRGVQIEES